MRWMKNNDRDRSSYDVPRIGSPIFWATCIVVASVMLACELASAQNPFEGEGGDALRGARRPRAVPVQKIEAVKPAKTKPSVAPNPFAEDGEDGAAAQPPVKPVAPPAHDHEDEGHDHEHVQQRAAPPAKQEGVVGALFNLFGGAAMAPPPPVAVNIVVEAVQPVAVEQMNVGGFMAAAPVMPNVNSTLSSSHSLTIDEDQQRRLNRAAEFAEEGRFDLAVPLWQKVLDEAGEQLAIAKNEETGSLGSYNKLSPVSAQIEAKLGSLPAAGLREYRVNVDPEVSGLLGRAQGDEREAALANVVLKYFLSSDGDNATFELACLKLERSEYHAALQLLNKLQSYPDSDVPRSQVLIRLAVAQGRVGDDGAAAATMKELNDLGNLTSSRVMRLVSTDVKESALHVGSQTIEVDGWPMRYGTSAHDGHMPDIDSVASAGYSEIFEQRPSFPLVGIPNLPANAPKIHMSTNGKTKQMIYINGVIIDPDVYAKEQKRVIDRKYIVAEWKKRGGRLVGDLLLSNGRAYLDGGDRIICCDLETGAVVWSGHPNAFEVDEMSRTRLLMKIADQRYGYAAQGQQDLGTASELQLFGDQVHHSMSIAHGMLLAIEGNLAGQRRPIVNQQQMQMMMWRGQQGGMQRQRTNWLTAYDAAGGKLIWNRTAAKDGREQTTAGFLCAPVATRDALLVPVSTDGKCWLYGLNPEDGATKWTAFLGDEPAMATTQLARASVAVDGGEAFVTTGIGTMYAIDAITGSVKWGIQYHKHDEPAAANNVQAIRLRGALSPAARALLPAKPVNDTAIIVGNKVLAMASDYHRVFALDRTSGEIVWHVDLRESDAASLTDYCVGISGGSIVLAGPQMVRAIDIESGKLRWKQSMTKSYGRGCVTENFVYVPDGHSVLKLAVTTGEVVAKTAVVSSTDEPIGNLYSDGSHLLVLGLGRMYVLGDLDLRLKELAAKIASGDGLAFFSRAKIHHRLEKPQDMLADLTQGYEALLKGETATEANNHLFAALDAVDYAKTSPTEAIKWTLKAAEAEKGETITDHPSRNRVLQSALATLQQGAKLTAVEILALVPYCRTPQLSSLAQSALLKIVTANDEALMRQTLKTTDPFTRRVARAGLAAALRKADKPRLLELLKSKNENERLAGAVALAVDAHREALPVLGDLLTSHDKDVCASAIATLRQLTGKSFQYDPNASIYRRRRATTNWQAWISREGKTAALNTASAKPKAAGKFSPNQVDVLIRGGLLVD